MKTKRRNSFLSKTRRQTGAMKCDSCGKYFTKLKHYEGEQFCSWCHKQVLKRIESAPNMEEVFRDISLFKNAGVGKQNNHELNNRRESVLLYLYNPPIEFLADEYWAFINAKWKEFINTLCDKPFDDVRFKKMGGRNYNYDIEITFLNKKTPVCVVKSEFKHNANSIDGLPEYLSPAANKPYFDITYGDYFYDKYIDKVCSLSDQARLLKPTKPEYIRFLYQNEYKKNPFFSCLYETELVDKKFYNNKSELVKESIQTYLETYLPTINLKMISDDIRKRQQGKIFILWNLKNFKSDYIRDDEMDIIQADTIKNKNTILAISKAGTIHEMLLRWKNHLGVLYPAWQISLTR
jgi:hypothetical protein